MSIQESEKALRYLAQLDSARCNAQWQQVPELARKVEKHAPHPLALTARSEAQVATYVPPERPSTSTSESTRSRLSNLIPPLLQAITEERVHPEDAFQANACLAWLHWVLREPDLAVAPIPKDIGATLLNLDATGTHSPLWIQVCGVKSAYIKGFGQEKTNNVDDALETYTSMLNFLSSVLSPGSMSPEFRLWSERLLTRMVALVMGSAPGERLDLNRTLQIFHLWTSLFSLKPTAQHEQPSRAPPPVELGSEVLYSRWDVWVAYYDTLSYILRNGFVYSPSYSEATPLIVTSRFGISDEDFLKVRLRQRSELKMVESSMETKLLEETRFPRANERNERVEKWIDAVMQNWRIMCGPTWQDAELGEGGKNALARGVLDILYRAATKTFHSTRILRHLFNVHASVADFDLALRAFDTYVELVTRGKDRVLTSGDVNFGTDNGDEIILTVTAAIRMLCRFGGRKDAEKARDVAAKLQVWLEREQNQLENGLVSHQSRNSRLDRTISPRSISIVYHALGTSEANWARWTYDASSRTEIQSQAGKYLRQALDARWNNSNDLEILFTFALLLAESRDIPSAIKVVKQALAQPTSSRTKIPGLVVNGLSTDRNGSSGLLEFAHERKLVPFWHLLALLLSSRADPTNASKACDAAFEQFQDPSNLFGHENEHRIEQLDEKEKPRSNLALVDRMGRFEKEGIIQVKITKLALIEELEGPANAVDSSTELLALYARLFGDPRINKTKLTSSQLSRPPKTAMNSIRASILGRSRSRGRGERTGFITQTSTRPSTRSTAVTAAPAIQVTDETGFASSEANGHHEQHSPFGRRSHHSGYATPDTKPESAKLHKGSASIHRRSEESTKPESALIVNDPIPITDAATNIDGTIERDFASVTSPLQSSTAATPVIDTSPGPSAGPDQPLHNLPRDQEPPSPGQTDQLHQQDSHPPAPHPATKEATTEPHFAALQERHHKITLLVELWTFVAGLYTRAGLYDDAKGALDEASELVQTLENEIATVSSSARAFADKNWGGGKPVEELWGDVWAQRGELSRASSMPFDAITYFEKALAHFSDHPTAIIGLSELLLDIFEQKMPAEPPETSALSSLAVDAFRLSQLRVTGDDAKLSNNAPPSTAPDSPEALDRLVARDRAYHLLSTLTKLDSGWDSSEAWFVLARAYEMSGQPEKAKDSLWWCVELEDTRPIRHWRCLGPGGFAL